MLFTSPFFFAFLAATLFAYFAFHKSNRWQNIVLLVASYVSYGLWDWRFLGLIVGLTGVNYAAGWAIQRGTRKTLYLGLEI
jgi:D-alanyl-lipoteichoic acid acyltransferase DltB (MBOAT superfamily)